jgi:tetratricopeptide (TPR) repeat protein
MGTAFPEIITDLLAVDGRLSRAAHQDVPFAELDLRLSGLEGLKNYQQRLDVDYLITGTYETRGDGKLIVRCLVVDRLKRRYLSEVLPGSAQGLVQISSEIAGVVRRELRLPLLGADGRGVVDAIYADLPQPAWPSYFAGLGHEYSANHEKAVELLTEAMSLAPRSPLPGWGLAQTLRATGRKTEAAPIACRAEERAERLPVHDHAEIAALCYEYSGRTAAARNVYESLIREHPTEQARYRIKVALLDLRDAETDRLNDGLNVLQDLRRADPSTLRASDLLGADLQEAAILYQKDRYAEARTLAREAAARASSLHAYAELALARKIEGESLLLLRDFIGAIAPLKDACTHLDAARREIQAARCKESLVMAQFFGERIPRYDLLVELRELYQEIGDLGSVGRMIHMEAILRHVRGEHAEAERLSREAEALFRRIGAHRELADAQLLLGTQLLTIGELQEARKALNKAYADLSRLGQTDSAASALRNLGEIDLLRGYLLDARQAFEASSSSRSIYKLAQIEALEGKFDRAIQRLEPLLVQEEKRDPALAAEIAMELADLRQTTGEAGVALELSHRAEKLLDDNESKDLHLRAQLQLIGIYLAQKNFAAANEKFEAIRLRAEKSSDHEVRIETGITAARLKGLIEGERRRDEALSDLAEIERGCVEKENMIYAFEARLAAGQLMPPPARRENLDGVAREARRLGLEGIARQAEKIRGEE